MPRRAAKAWSAVDVRDRIMGMEFSMLPGADSGDARMSAAATTESRGTRRVRLLDIVRRPLQWLVIGCALSGAGAAVAQDGVSPATEAAAADKPEKPDLATTIIELF